jgi:hypothetical protein
MTRPPWGPLVGATYVIVVAGLTAYAFRSDGNEFGRAEGLAALLSLPSVVGLLPVIYLGGALAWNLHDSGAPMLLVTAFFTATMAGAALGNLWLARQVGRLIRPRRAP